MNVQTINSSVQQLALSAVPAGGLFVYGGAAWLKSGGTPLVAGNVRCVRFSDGLDTEYAGTTNPVSYYPEAVASY